MNGPELNSTTMFGSPIIWATAFFIVIIPFIINKKFSIEGGDIVRLFTAAFAISPAVAATINHFIFIISVRNPHSLFDFFIGYIVLHMFFAPQIVICIIIYFFWKPKSNRGIWEKLLTIVVLQVVGIVGWTNQIDL